MISPRGSFRFGSCPATGPGYTRWMNPGAAPTTADILATLVSFDTTSRNSNLNLIAWVRDFLAGHRVEMRESRDPTGAKGNIHAVIGPQRPGGVAFSGHVDTVPVDGQSWRTDPFRLHARGATDMKGFVASMLAAVPDLLASGSDVPVHLFITFDEETDCAGAHRLVDDLAESGLRPAVCIVGEPSSLRPGGTLLRPASGCQCGPCRRPPQRLDRR